MPQSAGRLLVLICTALILPGVAAATGPAPDVASPGLGGAPAYDPAEAGSGELLWKGPHGLVPLPVIGIEVDIRVTGMMVRGSVTQTFSNPIPAVIEALYVFPLPERAAVDAMEMRVGNRRIVAVVQEKEAARRTYERARKEGRKAGLVDQKRPNMFTTSVANINPGETISVRLEYLEELAYDDGVFSLVFPLTYTPRYHPSGEPTERSTTKDDGRPVVTAAARHADTGAQAIPASLVVPHSRRAPRAAISVSIDGGRPLEYLRSSSHPIEVHEEGDSWRVAPLHAPVVADRDFILSWKIRRPQEPSGTLFIEERGGERYGLAMLVPPTSDSRPGWGMPTETLFIIDVSGSMAGPSIGQARRALLEALGSLRHGDAFNLLKFNHGSEALSERLLPADGASLEAARDWVNRLEAGGGTEILAALSRGMTMMALADPWPARRIVVITDGAVGNEQQVLSMVARSLHDTRLHIIGIGSAPNRYLMRRLATFGRGACEFIGRIDEVEKRMTSFLDKIDRPVLTDLKLQWEGASPLEVYPSRLPDLYAGEPLYVSMRLAPDGGPTRVVLSGQLGEKTISTPLEINDDAPWGSGVATRWARARVRDAIDRIHWGGDAATIRDEVIAVATRFNLVTRFTSLVAVEEFRTAQGEWSTQPLAGSLPYGTPGVGALPIGGTSGPLRLLAGLVLMAAAIVLRRLARVGAAR